jgi:hypothetical protein
VVLSGTIDTVTVDIAEPSIADILDEYVVNENLPPTTPLIAAASASKETNILCLTFAFLFLFPQNIHVTFLFTERTNSVHRIWQICNAADIRTYERVPTINIYLVVLG